MSPHLRKRHAVSLEQAALASPTLARLAELAQQSSLWLQAVKPLIPIGLRPLVQAGPIDDGNWCLLVKGNIAAAKIRQLLPTLHNRLAQQGYPIKAIRLKVQP